MSELLNLELRMLLLRYGRKTVLRALASLTDQTAEQIEKPEKSLRLPRYYGNLGIIGSQVPVKQVGTMPPSENRNKEDV